MAGMVPSSDDNNLYSDGVDQLRADLDEFLELFAEFAFNKLNFSDPNDGLFFGRVEALREQWRLRSR